MKGIILAGGTGSRLHPSTIHISKQLLPIYDKPMIYYPLSVLMLANIRDILIITTEHEQHFFKSLLGDGSQLGMSFTYEVQKKPEGIAQSILIAEKFIDNQSCCLILGDNIFYGNNFSAILEEASELKEGAIIFGYHVSDPERYGVASLDKNNKVIGIEEKPQNPKSNNAITGLYFYDKKAVSYAKSLKPSLRGELEITDLNNLYLKNENLFYRQLPRGFAWLDTGTHESLLEASSFVSIVEKRQGLKIGCIEEIAFKKQFINKDQLINLASKLMKNSYGAYLMQLVD